MRENFGIDYLILKGNLGFFGDLINEAYYLVVCIDIYIILCSMILYYLYLELFNGYFVF